MELNKRGKRKLVNYFLIFFSFYMHALARTSPCLVSVCLTYSWFFGQLCLEFYDSKCYVMIEYRQDEYRNVCRFSKMKQRVLLVDFGIPKLVQLLLLSLLLPFPLLPYLLHNFTTTVEIHWYVENKLESLQSELIQCLLDQYASEANIQNTNAGRVLRVGLIVPPKPMGCVTSQALLSLLGICLNAPWNSLFIVFLPIFYYRDSR